MKLLEVEMAKFAVAITSSSPANLISMVKAVLTIWKQLADEIVESSESAVEVLNDLLNYDKIEVGTLKLEFGVFPVCALVEKTVAAMQVQAQQKGITIELHHLAPILSSAITLGSSCSELEECREPRVVIGDLVRMRQVLRNLISNALKFTPDGGSVSVSGKPLMF
jgi:signal transduction histidine kinase